MEAHMGRARILIVLIVVIIIVAVGVVVLLPTLQNRNQVPTGTGTPGPIVPSPDDGEVPTAAPTQTPVQMVEIVIALQDLPRGFRIPANAVTLGPWPEELAPFNAITNLEDVIGTVARTDIFREQPILSNLVVEDLIDIAHVGSDAAAILPSNLVAVAIPMDRLTSVAYAVQDGDRVDIIMSMLFVDVDESFQSLVPNEITAFSITEEGDINVELLGEGRLETTLAGPVVVGPFENQRPRLVTQRTIQEAFVVHVGTFPIDGRFIGLPDTPTAAVVAQATSSDEEGTPVLTATPERPDIITLGVSPQDAVVLTWAVEARIPITLALRSASDTSRVPTTAVNLDYIMNEFSISVPVKRPYAIEPAIRSIRQLIAGDQIRLHDEPVAPTARPTAAS
jgi:Flp pilus assembly protein CpaB